MKPDIILIGGGNHAHYSIDIIEKEDKYNILGIIDSVQEVGSIRFGYPILGRQEDIKDIIKNYSDPRCPVGGLITMGDNWSRYYVRQQIEQLVPGFPWFNAIHPSVIIGNDVQLGHGIIAMAGVIFNPKSVIKDFTFFATGAQIEHDCMIREYASVSAGSTMGGFVDLGRFSAITLGVTIADRIKIGENSVIGAGSLVLKDIPDNILAYGSPAKFIRNREQGERFLK